MQLFLCGLGEVLAVEAPSTVKSQSFGAMMIAVPCRVTHRMVKQNGVFGEEAAAQGLIQKCILGPMVQMQGTWRRNVCKIMNGMLIKQKMTLEEMHLLSDA